MGPHPLAPVVDPGEIRGVFPRVPLARFGLFRFRPLLDLLGRAGIHAESVWATGSWATGRTTATSDCDLVIAATPASVAAARPLLGQAIAREEDLVPPDRSNTWEFLQREIGDPMALAREGRFAETFTLRTPAEGIRLSLIYVRPERLAPSLGDVGPLRSEPVTVEGVVSSAVEAPFKPARYHVATDAGETVEVECWHKLAGILRAGDRVRVAAQKVVSRPPVRLFQIDSRRDAIRILAPAR